MVLESKSQRGEIFIFLQEYTKEEQSLRAWVGAIRRESTREQRAELFSRKKCKARTVVERGGR